MFVSHIPDRIFDVERYEDRCVCGRSAVVTNHSGYNTGYCDECSEKRDKFVNRIVDNIDLYTNKKEVNLALILEQIRKRTIQERLYYLIDKWFADENNNSVGNRNEPYKDKLFIVNCIQEKQDATNTLFHHFNDKDINTYGDNTLPNNEYKSPLLRTNYYNEIVKMYHKDRKRMDLSLSMHIDDEKSCEGCLSEDTCDMLEFTYTNCKILSKNRK